MLRKIILPIGETTSVLSPAGRALHLIFPEMAESH